MIEETDYSNESEEEFLEDFETNLADEDLNEILIKARKNSDAELRVIVKELQYVRFLMKHLVNFIEGNNENSALTELAKNYVKTIRTK
jgi:hypothetical protein